MLNGCVLVLLAAASGQYESAETGAEEAVEAGFGGFGEQRLDRTTRVMDIRGTGPTADYRPLTRDAVMRPVRMDISRSSVEPSQRTARRNSLVIRIRMGVHGRPDRSNNCMIMGGIGRRVLAYFKLPFSAHEYRALVVVVCSARSILIKQVCGHAITGKSMLPRVVTARVKAGRMAEVRDGIVFHAVWCQRLFIADVAASAGCALAVNPLEARRVYSVRRIPMKRKLRVEAPKVQQKVVVVDRTSAESSIKASTGRNQIRLVGWPHCEIELIASRCNGRRPGKERSTEGEEEEKEHSVHGVKNEIGKASPRQAW